MIKINLLEYRKTRLRIRIQKELFIMGLIVFFIVIVMSLLSSNINRKIEALNSVSTLTQQEVDVIRRIVKQVEEFEKKEVSLKELIDIIKILKANQTSSVIILDEINATIPKDIWLTSIRQEGNKIKLIGYAFSNTEIAQFMKNMELTNLIVNIELVESSQTSIEQEKVNKFTIQFEMKI